MDVVIHLWGLASVHLHAQSMLLCSKFRRSDACEFSCQLSIDAKVEWDFDGSHVTRQDAGLPICDILTVTV